MSNQGLNDTRVPVLLITGFLGSGKTTFINWLLKERPNDNISIILNEYGNIQLESQFLETRPFGVVSELANGCMCCVAKDDIPRVVEYILEKAPHTSQIIIEASGLSDPDPVALALQEGRLIETIRLDTIIAIIDAMNFEEHRSKYPIVMSQIADADLLVLSKVSEISKDQEIALVDQLRSIGLNTKVLVWNDQLSSQFFVELGSISETKKPHEQHDDDSHHHDHFHDRVSEIWIQRENSETLQHYQEAYRALPSGVIRSKGMIFVGDQKYLVQYVGNRLQIIPAQSTDSEPKQTNLLFLGLDISQEELEKLF